jgi:ABC-type phosphate transport system ATPase subunit
MALLEIHDIHTFYGTIEALKGISLEVNSSARTAPASRRRCARSPDLRLRARARFSSTVRR